MLKINTVTMKEEIEDILMNSYDKFGNFNKPKATKELLNLFSVNYYGETLYNTDGVIPSKSEDENPRIVTFKDNCS
jgi:hypothetical protein|tara:strand:+ start:573 stop:800 length:228 start_codon:yes stop_codon:yes gene_type:complete